MSPQNVNGADSDDSGGDSDAERASLISSSSSPTTSPHLLGRESTFRSDRTSCFLRYSKLWGVHSQRILPPRTCRQRCDTQLTSLVAHSAFLRPHRPSSCYLHCLGPAGRRKVCRRTQGRSRNPSHRRCRHWAGARDANTARVCFCEQ